MAGLPGIFGKKITEADPAMVLETLRNAALSAFLVGQQAARLMLINKPNASGAKGTIIFTNASAALKGFPSSGAFAMACHAKSGLAQSMARELMPQGIHVANVPIDAAIGWTQEDGTRAHRRAGTTVDDNMADPDSHRRNVSPAAPPASVNVGVRSRASALGRKMVIIRGADPSGTGGQLHAICLWGPAFNYWESDVMKAFIIDRYSKKDPCGLAICQTRKFGTTIF